MSVKPSVASSAVRATRPSSSAFVATVIPCTKRSTSPGARAGASRASVTAVQHALGLVLRGGGRLGRDQPVGREQRRVREGAADVDPEDHAAAALATKGRLAQWVAGSLPGFRLAGEPLSRVRTRPRHRRRPRSPLRDACARGSTCSPAKVCAGRAYPGACSRGSRQGCRRRSRRCGAGCPRTRWRAARASPRDGRRAAAPRSGRSGARRRTACAPAGRSSAGRGRASPSTPHRRAESDDALSRDPHPCRDDG